MGVQEVIGILKTYRPDALAYTNDWAGAQWRCKTALEAHEGLMQQTLILVREICGQLGGVHVG